jgi:hypothetical protein
MVKEETGRGLGLPFLFSFLTKRWEGKINESSIICACFYSGTKPRYAEEGIA